MLNKRKSDLLVAGSVIACSVVLFIALAMGLKGTTFVPEGRVLKVRFHDITGIKVSSPVKYAGARAGVVSEIRMLDGSARATNPDNLVEITLRLFPDVPPLDDTTTVSIASDTLLSDKFVQVSQGPVPGTPLAAGAVVQGVSPTTFDTLVRNANGAIEGLQRTLGGGLSDGAGDLITKAESVLDGTGALIKALEPVVSDARTLMGDAREATSGVRSLVDDNKGKIGDAVTSLESASSSLNALTGRADRLIRDNEKLITVTLSDFKVSVENLKVAATYSKFLLNDLARRPTRLLWGGSEPDLPTERQILDSRKAIPLTPGQGGR